MSTNDHHHDGHGGNGHGHSNERMVSVRVLRQENPHSGSHWESFEVPYEHGMNITTVLLRIAANPVTTDHHETTPIAYDSCCLEEVCGACTMVINDRVRQGCSALVENLLKDSPEGITLQPMTKFPVVRDLLVNRKPMFESLKKIKAWVHVDGYYDLGGGPRISQKEQEKAYPLSCCMTCGCCVEACPQFNDHSAFIGPAAISQAVLFNAHPTAKVDRDDRLAVLSGAGGITDCGNSQNCVKVCPKGIPLTDSIAQTGRDTTIYKFRQWFGR
ncbi:MAG: succinate dehydrogenase iron-sulfur subunit [Planctomycetes bacterium]|nr:succinate dehydrogenase iron-sulfur subunit [Planctomycetota bacterium]